ncbi:hypothetical protein B0E34_17315 [Chryseobacterium mucoviscidosis]|uniref:Uncharacterized protein n=2 Tax=Chryseobacterium mucoviscidosis TaxID=1945581 RepID=A0A202BWU3_9FLAO|nr:hypothetical protein B0E34_17315 [Chryseobacterium mucoviscidosis]
MGCSTKKHTFTMENFETQEIIVTECFKCGRRFENYFNASPCCTSIVVKVNEKGNPTTITFLSSLSKPRYELFEEFSEHEDRDIMKESENNNVLVQ